MSFGGLIRYRPSICSGVNTRNACNFNGYHVLLTIYLETKINNLKTEWLRDTVDSSQLDKPQLFCGSHWQYIRILWVLSTSIVLYIVVFMELVGNKLLLLQNVPIQIAHTLVVRA